MRRFHLPLGLMAMGSIITAGLDVLATTPALSAAPPAPFSGGRRLPRSRYTGAKLREIRAQGQSRECARRRQAEARS